ncbi:MAG: alpha/beta fold hydrolase [Saprospiraceae bacterium]
MFKLDLPLDSIKSKYIDDNSKFVIIDKMNVHYKDEGEGKPLVLLHDAGLSLQIWNTMMPFLTNHFRVIRLDLPGFGLTTASERFDYSLDKYIYFVKKFTAAIGLSLDKFSVLGAGFGGHIAWQYTLLHQHRVEKLILINAQGYDSKSSLSLFQFDKKGGLGKFFLRWRGNTRMMNKLLRKQVGNESIINDKVIGEIQDLLLCKNNRKSLIQLSNATVKNRKNRITEINTPTLVIWGSKVEKVNFEKDLPKVKLKKYNGIGLLPMIENSKRTAEDIIQFFK